MDAHVWRHYIGTSQRGQNLDDPIIVCLDDNLNLIIVTASCSVDDR